MAVAKLGYDPKVRFCWFAMEAGTAHCCTQAVFVTPPATSKAVSVVGYAWAAA